MNNILHDPLYLGMRKTRPSTDELYSFVDEFVEAVQEVFPKCCIHFEDWTGVDAVHLLQRYRDKYCVYNDDVQGTAGITLAGMINATKTQGHEAQGRKIPVSRRGLGRYWPCRSALLRAGCARADSGRSAVTGLHVRRQRPAGVDRTDLVDFQKPYAHQHAPTRDFVAAIESIKPTTIIGVSTIGGAFNQKVIEAMSRINERPVILALSNPTEHAECTPEQAYTLVKGKAIYAAGVQFPPVHLNGQTSCRGRPTTSTSSRRSVWRFSPRRLTESPMRCSSRPAQAVADQVPSDLLKQGLLYPLQSNILETEIQTAARIAKLVFDSGLARVKRPADMVAFIREHVYKPEYQNSEEVHEGRAA